MLAIDDANLHLEIATRLAGAEEVRERIDSLLTHTTIAHESVIYQRKSRVKVAKSIFDKIQDRRRKMPERGYGLGDVGDVVGFRLITLYDDSLFDLFKELMRVIEQGQRIANPIFKRVLRPDGTLSLPNTFNDCCVFAQNRDDKNPYMQCEARIKQKFGLTDDALVRHEIRKNGYSSIHVQLDGLLYRDRATRSIPIEFQLRTALEDTWAEISHELEYKKRYDNLIDRDDWKISIANASDQLFTFKKAIDEATRQATAIRNAYNRIDAAIKPILRDREFVIERPVSLILIEARCGASFSGARAKTAEDLHVLLNRLVLDRRAVENEGSPLASGAPVELAPVKPKLSQDMRLRDGEKIIAELEEAFELEAADPDKLAIIRSLLALERNLLSIRVLVSRIAQLRYEKASQEALDSEIKELQQHSEGMKAFVQDRDATFQLIGASARAFAAGNVRDEASRRESTARAFDIAVRDATSANAPEIVKVAQTTLCLNALVHHLAAKNAQADEARKAGLKASGTAGPEFVKLIREILDDSMLVLTKFYDPAITYKLYASNIISIGNNVLMFVVELHDAGVDSKEIAQHISSQQISNITEMMGKADIENEYRGHRLHTLCGVYRALKRPEQWKRAVRELREHIQQKGAELPGDQRAAYEAELAKPFER